MRAFQAAPLEKKVKWEGLKKRHVLRLAGGQINNVRRIETRKDYLWQPSKVCLAEPHRSTYDHEYHPLGGRTAGSLDAIPTRMRHINATISFV